MRLVFATLLAILLTSISSGYTQSLHLSEPHENLTILITDKYNASRKDVIESLLALQSSLIIPLRQPIPEDNSKNGYLLIKMTPEYVNDLLTQKDGIIVSAYQKQVLVGYVLLVNISEFKELYQEESIGYIETSLDLDTLEALLSQPAVGYIEQIAVKPGYSKTGIGTQLINACKKLKPNGLVADVFITPLKNEPSLEFFSRTGFEKSGILHQKPRANFPYAHITQVFFWNLSCLLQGVRA